MTKQSALVIVTEAELLLMEIAAMHSTEVESILGEIKSIVRKLNQEVR